MTLELPLPLDRPRWEAFAQGCARGLSPRQAAQGAHYPRPGQKAAELLRRSKIRRRIAVIRARRDGGGSGEVGGLIDRLIALADRLAKEAKEARILDVARAALAEAGRLKQLMPPEPVAPPARPGVHALSLAEWREKYDPTWPGKGAADRP